ncbi:MAG: hypothetical protein O3C43_13155 [Verrucomicrobia bacterium]|nr:hypothetical protein [Verrucomicrobiota bacterium]
MSLPSGLPEEVADEEPLARFLTSSGHFSNLKVKQAAFLPSPKDGRTSVFRHGVEPKTGLESIGHLEIGSERNLYGAGIVKASDVRAVKLDVEAIEPPPRHADIFDWPWMKDDREFGKAQRKEMAILLAQKSDLVRFSE